MQKLLFVLPLWFLPVMALAQETPKLEVLGGYSNLSANVNASSINMSGFDASVAENVNSWFGGALDLSAHFGTEGGKTVNTESFSYGPVFSYRKSKSVTPFAHILLGAVRGGPG